MPEEGVVQFAPAVSIRLNANGDTEAERAKPRWTSALREVGIEGLVRASFDALVSAEGSCAMVAERRFPKKPITKMACAPPFCIMVVLQMLAEVELTGIVTGAAQVGASMDFQISGSVLVNTKGHSDVDFQTPSIKHQEGFGLAASAYGSARVGMGPVLTVWPMPGVPVVVNPMFNAEVRAQGTLRFSSGLVLAETKTQVTRTSFASNASRANHLEMCGAAALNMYADVDVQGFALPKAFTASLGTGWIKEKITESILSGARALAQLMTGPAACIPGVSTAAWLDPRGCGSLPGAITGLVPDLNLDFSTPSMQLLAPAKLYCKEVYRTPGFDSASCATELGCKFAGRPPTPLVAVLPASQVKEQDFNAWARPIGPPRGISFGFQYIQIGKFRVGAVDDDHLSISHVGGWTEQIFRSDGTLHAGVHKTWHTFDRPESAPTAINVGDRFLQLGKFRLGDADGNHFLVTHESGLTIQIYRSDGTTHPGPDTYWTSRISTRRPASWTCKDIAEMAYGTCSEKWAAFGDRFIQLGDWRLAAIDANHFSISHKDGQTPQIWRNDGTVHPGPRTDYNAWGRPLGFPSGIAFGPGFIQIGQFRLGQIDADHLSIAHKDSTAQIFRSDGTLHNGPRTDYTAWTRSTGPPSGITFGDRFLQLGRFRLGDAGAAHFIVTHDGGQTIQKYASIGTQHPGPRTDWTPALNNRYPQWHCGSVQTVLGTCTGIATGDDFLQLGEWRLGAMDGGHFSVSHQDGQTAQVFRSLLCSFFFLRGKWRSEGLESLGLRSVRAVLHSKASMLVIVVLFVSVSAALGFYLGRRRRACWEKNIAGYLRKCNSTAAAACARGELLGRKCIAELFRIV
ncbi:unnamed protein product [Symbiodinium natans]|uniref:Uncharacterized protein n=1 Tax=Symbiodinium natans TaxID=878477 RepID=A0A812QYW7_9DINO|nr:unnamed protein product [Symbiodinium natans]